MSRKFLVPINLNDNELLNAVIQQLSAASIGALAGPKGKLVYDTTNNVLKINVDGTTGGWQTLTTGATLSYGSPTGLTVGGANSDGVSSSVARSDHVHSLPNWGSVTAQTTFGASSGNGAATTFSRSDHTHGTPAAPTASSVGAVANAGNTPSIQADITANRPAFGTAGRLYVDTTTGLISRDTGAAWTQLAPFGATPSTQAVGDSATAGTTDTYARIDHKHGMPAFGAVTSQTSYGQSSGNGSASTIARSDHTHGTVSLTAVTPSTQAFGDSAVVGTGSAAAKEDHKHAMPAAPTASSVGAVANGGTAPWLNTGAFASRPATGYTQGRLYVDTTNNVIWYDNGSNFTTQLNAFAAPSGSAVGDAQAAGTAYTYARSDHVHAREAFGAVTAQTSYGSSSGNGAATTVARSDHTHGTVALSSNVASAQAPGDTATNGTGTAPAKDDHKHSLPGWGVVGSMAAANSFGGSNAAGSNATFARIDHQHALPAHDDSAHSGIHLNALAAATGNYSMGTNKITSLGTPTADTDAATKAYVDSMAAGLTDFKQSVRVATTAAGTLASSFANGQTVDNVTLATGDRILIKNQAAAAENGIYTVNASGAPTRATDMDANGELSVGTLVYVESGTANGSSQWVCSATGATPWVAGSSTSTWVIYSTVPSVQAGTGLSATSQGVLSVNTGTGLTTSGDNVIIDTSVVARKYTTQTHASATSFVVNHALGNQWVTCQVFDSAASYAQVECDVELTDANNVTLRFAVAPSANTLRIVITG